MYVLLLITGLLLVLGGAHFLTEGAAAVAERFRVPEFIIGATIVAVGTSMPELVVSFISAVGGSGDMAIGNVVGSNIFNVFVILGLCSVLRPMDLTSQNTRRDIPLALLSAVILLAVTFGGYLFGQRAGYTISRAEGAVLLALYGAYLWYTIRTRQPDDDKSGAEQPRKQTMALYVVMILGGLAALIFGGDMFVKSASELARRLGVSESVIALTIVAGGTSLPELATSVAAIIKGREGLALGNVLGSNVANILLILGVSAAVTPLALGSIDIWDILMVILGGILPFVAAFTLRRRRIDRAEGIVFVAIYVAYIWWLISRA